MALMEFVTDNVESNYAGKYPRMPSFGGVPFFVCLFVSFSIWSGFECSSVTMPVGCENLTYTEERCLKARTECLNRHTLLSIVHLKCSVLITAAYLKTTSLYMHHPQCQKADSSWLCVAFLLPIPTCRQRHTVEGKSNPSKAEFLLFLQLLFRISGDDIWKRIP